MAKRKETSDFACPGCQSKFDPEIHVPFMGSCGHSLCSICVNEQKIKDCLTCNKPKGFVWKQKNDLAIDLLDALRQLDAKKFDGSATTDFKCPDCHSKFDSEVHAPFVGSCGHSRCAYCVNDKDIKACSVCKKRRGFAWKQLNALAAELLATLAPLDVKKSKLDEVEEPYAPGEPVPAILDPNNHPFLAKIVNQLDPVSFLKLSSTCKPLHTYCFNSKDIKIVYAITSMNICTQKGALGFKLESYYEKSKYSRHIPANYKGSGFGFLGSMVNRKKIQNYPIVFKIKYLDVKANMDCDFLAKIRSFFSEFPVRAIWHIKVAVNSIDWDGFIQLLKDFYIGKVRMTYLQDTHDLQDPPTIPDEAATYLLQNTVHFSTDFTFSENLLLKASVPVLNMDMESISKNTFQDLVTKLAQWTNDIDWTLWCNAPSFGHCNSFPSLSVDYRGPLPSERPLTFYISRPELFWVLREDGKYLRCWFKGSQIELLTTEKRQVPMTFNLRDAS